MPRKKKVIRSSKIFYLFFQHVNLLLRINQIGIGERLEVEEGKVP